MPKIVLEIDVTSTGIVHVMGHLLDIAHVTRLTGLSSRALRFYEARGLVEPQRTQSGRRIYSACDLKRIHQIIALKAAGISLSDIQLLLSGRRIELKALLTAQLAAIENQALRIAETRKVIEAALGHIADGKPVDVNMLCSLIRSGGSLSLEMSWDNIIEQFWSGAAKEQFKERRKELRHAFAADAWVELGMRIKAALPLDPTCDEALEFVREWYGLLEPLRPLATEEMMEASAQMDKRMRDWKGKSSPGFDVEVRVFIREAALAARAAGRLPREAQLWLQNILGD